MAKKGQRKRYLLACETCRRRNYVTVRNDYNDRDKGKLEFRKYCPQCKVTKKHLQTKLPPSKKH